MAQTPQDREVDANYDFFQRHLGEFLPAHRGEYALLKSQKLVKFFASPGEAYKAAKKRFPDDVFSIQEVTDEPIDLGFFSYVAH